METSYHQLALYWRDSGACFTSASCHDSLFTRRQYYQMVENIQINNLDSFDCQRYSSRQNKNFKNLNENPYLNKMIEIPGPSYSQQCSAALAPVADHDDDNQAMLDSGSGTG